MLFRSADMDMVETMMETTTVTMIDVPFRLADMDMMETMMETMTVITIGATFRLADTVILVTTMDSEITTVTTIGASSRIVKTPTLENEAVYPSLLSLFSFLSSYSHSLHFWKWIISGGQCIFPSKYSCISL